MGSEPTSIQGGTAGPAGDGKALAPGTLTKRPVGRPPGAAGPRKLETKAGPLDVKNPVKGDPLFVVEAAVSVLELVDDSAGALLVTRARRVLHPDFVREFESTVEASKWGPKQKELLRKALDEMARKYDWATKYGAEILLVLLMVQHAAEFGRVMSLLSRMESQTAKARQVAVNQKPKPEEPAAPAKPVDLPGPVPFTPPVDPAKTVQP